ncbi:MAG: tannase/feruloyl esterase family alpha/beta hydrolase [Amphiplicatus sp.]
MTDSNKKASLKRPACLGIGLAIVALMGCGGPQETKTAAPDEAAAGMAQPGGATVEALQKMLPANAEVLSATTAQTPDYVQYVRVDGVVTVDDPGPWPVRFMLALPEKFNGRYFMISQGGTGGSVPDPDPGMLREGFAVAAMDRGTKPAFSTDPSVWSDPVQGLNLAHRAMHAAAVATQQLTRAYYGVSSIHRYTAGCSGGGVAGWNHMRAHGADDFEGVVIGDGSAFAPANNVQWARMLQYLLNHPEGWIPPDLMAAAEKAVIEKYDGADGAADGIIQDARLIDFDVNVLRDAGLSDAQIKAVQFANASWTYHLANSPITVRGLPITRMSDWTNWYFGTKPPPWTDLDWPEAPRAYPGTKSFFEALPGKPDLKTVNLDDPEGQTFFIRPDGSSSGPFDFHKFRDGGGKVIAYFASDDPIGSFLQYGLPALEGARALEDDPHNIGNWMRLFSIPGMLHCRGGAGPDDVPQQTLNALIAWVEKGEAPDSILAHRKDGRSFLLCPEPMRATFKGGGENADALDVNDAANWACASGEQ